MRSHDTVPFEHKLVPWLALIGALAIAFAGTSHAQISPGPLSMAHRNLDGPTNCTSCHSVATGGAKFRCLDCHKEIASRIASRRGFHATALPAGAGGETCVRCHSEHNGRDFQIVRWDPKTFDHTKTGFSLAGKHATAQCATCHKPQNIAAVERTSLPSTNLNKTYLGLSPTCATCHQDKHQGRLGADCQRCHSTTDWKVQGTFDHSKTRYPLTGLHARVTCQKCHTMPDTSMKYVGLNFSDCNACHTDPHKGYFRQNCQDCHSTIAWKTPATDAKVDHSRTTYPLLGKHVDVKCESCHSRGDFARKVLHNECASCHKPDPHRGQFAKRTDGGRCESCHTVNGFKQATFTVVDHRKTAYPLEGKHSDVSCAKCHVPAGKDTLFKVKFAACTDCHKDSHGAQFANAPYFNKCESCHTLAGFHPGTFTMTRHQQTRFRLTGGHVAVACLECHKKSASDGPATYHFAGLECTVCHADPHRGEFSARIANARAGGPQGCEVCHSTAAWNDLAAFDHSTTKFQLTGAHRATQCAGCHRPPNLELSMKNVDFRSASQQCEECHEDPHARQFAKAGGVTRCAECHNTTKWRPSLFNHASTKFPLDGAHKDVPCALCHKDARLVSEKRVLFYRPTPTACASCHGIKLPTPQKL